MPRRLAPILPALLLAACAPMPAAPPAGPADGWVLARLSGLPLGAPASLRLTADGIAGSGPCNGYSAAVATGPGGAFDVGPVIRTERACPALVQEEEFLAALGQVTQRREAPGLLVLSGPAQVLEFVPPGAPAP